MNRSLKQVIDSHFIIRHYKKSFQLVAYVYDSIKRNPYTIYYKSDGKTLTISYTGPEFGIKELKATQIETQNVKREYGGNGTKIILDAVNDGTVDYKYEDGVNIWSFKGEFEIFEYAEQIPEDMFSFAFGDYYEQEIEKDPILEVSFNIISHHNIIYPKSVTLLILKVFVTKHIPREIKLFRARRRTRRNYSKQQRKQQEQKAIADTLTGPDITVPCEFEEIMFELFKDREDIVNLTIPEGITDIGHNAFENCINLESVSFPESVTYIGSYAFGGCINLEHIELPPNIGHLTSDVFHGCEKLREVLLPNGELSIYSAFEGCISLKEIYIPSGVKELYRYTFRGCTALERITVDPSNAHYCDIDGVLFSKDKKTLIVYPAGRTEQSYEVPDGVTEIGEQAFRDCINLRSVTIPESVTVINKYAFCGCSNLTDVIILGKDVRIRTGAFKETPYGEEMSRMQEETNK